MRDGTDEVAWAAVYGAMLAEMINECGLFPTGEEMERFVGAAILIADQAERAACIIANKVALNQTPTCSTCNDTHRMQLGERSVMCTRCPLPCQDCRGRDRDPYCATNPCKCACHGRRR